MKSSQMDISDVKTKAKPLFPTGAIIRSVEEENKGFTLILGGIFPKTLGGLPREVMHLYNTSANLKGLHRKSPSLQATNRAFSHSIIRPVRKFTFP